MRKDLGKQNYFFPQPVLVLGTYDENEVPNAMVAAWGSTYDTNQIIICMSTEHKTTDNLKKQKAMTIHFATQKVIKQVDYIGLVSGHETVNKLEVAGFHTHPSTHVHAPIIEELPLSLECSVNKMMFDEAGETAWVILDIVNVTCDEEYLDDDKPDIVGMKLVTYDSTNHTYKSIGKTVSSAFNVGKELIK